ncbi:MAG: hypothetical protein MUP13_10005 [Thermoanaerobaculales bacterium]|nr:hypothetical protein [Thermoanaerobaculales bacterium]
MTGSEITGSTTTAKLCSLLAVGFIAWNAVLLVMGSFDAIRGEGLSDWGGGPGGLNGLAYLIQLVFGFAVGLIAAVSIVRVCRSARSVLIAVTVFVGGLLVPYAYLAGGHLVDPCTRGWWSEPTQIGGAKLCEVYYESSGPIRVATYNEISGQFHLALHASIGMLSAVAVALAFWRIRLFGCWPTTRSEIADR